MFRLHWSLAPIRLVQYAGAWHRAVEASGSIHRHPNSTPDPSVVVDLQVRSRDRDLEGSTILGTLWYVYFIHREFLDT
jgi:hypothetical protein